MGGGIYRLEFDLDRYFSSLGIEPFYSAVSIRVQIADERQPHHISLFITPYSCATYHANWNLEAP
jgi:5-hydroxyisourate hydrolase-like protein (transthyretin family)